MTSWYYLQRAVKNKRNKSEFNFMKYFTQNPEYNDATKDDFNSRCRICLRSGTIPIFKTCDNFIESVVDTLQSITGIKISEHDDNPKRICTVCYTFIEIAILFRQTAKKSQDILKEPLKSEKFTDHSDDLDNSYPEDIISDIKPSEEISSYVIKENKIKHEKKDKIKCSSKVTCHVCKKVINRSYYKEHATIHDPDHKKYVCDVCGKSFRLRCAYHNHSLRHRNDFPYKCTFCPYRGRYAELLKTHMRTHTGDYRYMCTECPARFLFKSNLNSHMLKHKEPTFKCDTCNRAFHTTLALQRHNEADHLGIKNHVCNICGKAFGYRNAMMKHQRHVHKREKLLFGRMPSYLEVESKNLDNVIPE